MIVEPKLSFEQINQINTIVKDYVQKKPMSGGHIFVFLSGSHIHLVDKYNMDAKIVNCELKSGSRYE